jgi:glycosyltransferase involved in cell wall biosynthesis
VLSILVPVYNADMSALTRNLISQCRLLQVPVEIILVDDGSVEEFKVINRAIPLETYVRYIELPSNIGRAAIRNFLAKLATYPWILYLDCDSDLVSREFLSDYLKCANIPQVVCGGRIYGKQTLDRPQWRLHRKYGISREQKSALQRNKYPYRSFMTNNFLIPTTIFNRFSFDEKIRSYGHEDTLFGFELMKQGIPVIHIDNPVEHLILDNNATFVQKSEEAARNLARITSSINDPDFLNEVTLLRFYRKLGKRTISRLLFIILEPLVPLLRWLLKTIYPSLLILDILKVIMLHQEFIIIEKKI